MDESSNYFQCIEIKSLKKPSSNAESVAKFEVLMQQKKDLEHSHKTIVRSAVNPFLNKGFVKNAKTLSRSKEFIVKRVQRINFPSVPRKDESTEFKSVGCQNEEIPQPEEIIMEASLTNPQISPREKPAYTSISHAEDLFGKKKHENIETAAPIRSSANIKSRFNNRYTRIIAGSSTDRISSTRVELFEDSLKSLEAKLPTRFRSTILNSPWTYSSVHRTSRIFTVKSRTAHGKKNFS